MVLKKLYTAVACEHAEDNPAFVPQHSGQSQGVARDEVIKQAKREALPEAADKPGSRAEHGLRRMANSSQCF